MTLKPEQLKRTFTLQCLLLDLSLDCRCRYHKYHTRSEPAKEVTFPEAHSEFQILSPFITAIFWLAHARVTPSVNIRYRRLSEIHKMYSGFMFHEKDKSFCKPLILQCCMLRFFAFNKIFRAWAMKFHAVEFEYWTACPCF